MRRLMVGMPYLLSLLLLVAFSVHAAAQSAEAPTFMVGDEWKWSSGPVQTVVKVDGDVTVIKGTRGCATCLVHFNKSFVMMKVEQADGSPTDTSVGFVPVGSEWKLLDFPLQVGKKWNVGAKGFFENRVRHYDIVISVQDYEDVTTKGGTFKAFKITRDWTIRPIGNRGRGISWSTTDWYAPDVKRAVKGTTTNPNQKDWELVSYTVK